MSAKTKDGFYKVNYDNTYVLLANGSQKQFGNDTNNIPISNGIVNSNLNADLLDGLHIHTGINNEVNKIVRTNSDGTIMAGWINTISGDMTTTPFTRVYVSNDQYIRYVSNTNFIKGIGGPFLPLVGGTMTGTIHREYSSSDDTPFIWIDSGDYDNYIFQVSSGTTSKQYYGYALKYIGAGSGIKKFLRLYADNQNSTDVIALSVNQSGNIGIGSDALDSYRLYVSGNSVFYGHLYPEATNAYDLGSPSLRWRKLYIGSADSYGSATKPIYWNNGVPTACTYSLNADVNSGTKDTLAYYSTTTSISSYTSTKGSNTKLFYLNAGVPTESTGNVGSGVIPIYLLGGTLIASTSTVGASDKPIWMNGGTLTQFNSTIGATNQPIFLNNGEITATTANIGSGVKPIYMLNGIITASTNTVGSTVQPVWLNTGVITAFTTTVGASNKPIYMSGGSITASTANIGSGVIPIYMSSGILTASTSTVGASDKPIFLNSGSLTASSSTIGSGIKPIYMDSGTLTASSSSIGSGIIPIFLSSGTLTASTSSVGSSTQGIYLSSGAITAMSYSLGSNVSSGTANRIAWYSAATTISSGSITTDGAYLGSVSYLSINTPHQTSYRLRVDGDTYHNGMAYFKHPSASQTINIGYNTATWSGDASDHPMIWGGDGSTYYTMIATPHIPFLENSTNGYTGSTLGAIIRIAGKAGSDSSYWDIGCPTEDLFEIKRSGSRFVSITNSGNVGIGTTSPNQKLEVLGSDYPVVRLNRNNSLYGCGIEFCSNSTKIGTIGYDKYWSLFSIDDSSGTKLFTINYTNGNTGIGTGTVAPAYKLDVNGKINSTNGTNTVRIIPDYDLGIYMISTSNWIHIAGTGANMYIYNGEWDYAGTGNYNKGIIINTSNNIGIGNGSPSYKLDVNGITRSTNFISSVAIGTQPYACTSTTLNTNLNSDLLDGIHANGLLTAASLGTSGNSTTISVTVGGTTKTSSVTVPFATTSSELLTNNTAQAGDACYNASGGLHFYRFNGTGNTIGGGDGWILQWSWGAGSVGGQLYVDDNPSGIIGIRGCTGSSGNSPTGFTSWWRLYSDDYHPLANSVPWTGVTGVMQGGNEFNIPDSGYAHDSFWFNYLPRNSRSNNSKLLANYYFGNLGQGYASLIAAGFKKNGSSDSYVLLGGGGHKALSDFAMANAYLPLAGGTMTGTIVMNGASFEQSGKRWMYGTVRNSGFKYDYNGNEAFIISAGTYGNARISFYTCGHLNMNDSNGQWNATTADVYIHNNNLYISNSGYASSDIRKKYDIRNILEQDVIDLFNTENGYIRHFKWKSNNQSKYGFIAQEIQEYCPEAIDIDSEGYLFVNYDAAICKIIGAMFKKIKEQDRIIKDLQRKMEEL